MRFRVTVTKTKGNIKRLTMKCVHSTKFRGVLRKRKKEKIERKVGPDMLIHDYFLIPHT